MIQLARSERRIATRSIFIVLALLLILTMAACGTAAGEEGRNPADSGALPAGDGQEPGSAGELILATTTSTRDSGLLDVLIPRFEEQTGYRVKVVAVGTGKALAMAEDGNADAVMVHAPEAEKPLVDEGILTNYRLVMHNDFVVVGPENDPAGIREAPTAFEAFRRIAAAADEGNKEVVFVSRGDDSGTHKKELYLWQGAGVDPQGRLWYPETGQGMGQTLMIANQKLGYTLTDRATFLHNQHNLELTILLEGNGELLNIYHVAQVNPEKFPDRTIHAAAARAFVEYLLTPETQELIGDYGKDRFGEPLFFPDGGKTMEELGK